MFCKSILQKAIVNGGMRLNKDEQIGIGFVILLQLL